MRKLIKRTTTTTTVEDEILDDDCADEVESVPAVEEVVESAAGLADDDAAMGPRVTMTTR